MILDDDNTEVFRKYRKARWTDSWLLEGYAQLARHLGRFGSIHFGYRGYILKGLAVAPDQRDVSTRSYRKINLKGQIVIDGLLAGASINF